MSKEIDYATHLVGLWMCNDKGIHDDMLDLEKSLSSTCQLPYAIRSYFEDRMPECDGVQAGLIDYVMELVDWDFLANELSDEINGRYK